MKDNGVIKLNKREDFTICQNDIIRHVSDGMSAKALGVYMIIKYYINIPNFTVRKEHIQRVSGEGKKAFETVWKELKELGYIEQKRLKTSEGKWNYEYTLFNSREEVEENKKASTVPPVKANKENIKSNNSIPQNDLKDTDKNEKNKESEIIEIINNSCVNIRKQDLKKCEEEFTDIDKLKKALEICEIDIANGKKSHGIKALRMAYKYGDRNSNTNIDNDKRKGSIYMADSKVDVDGELKSAKDMPSEDIIYKLDLKNGTNWSGRNPNAKGIFKANL